MTSLTTTVPNPIRAPEIPAAVLDSVAAQVRGLGVVVLWLTPAGAIAWHDAAAGAFHDRYVGPALSRSDLLAGELASRVATLNSASPATVWQFVPGVTLCAIPWPERRQLFGVLAIAARSETFALDEDVVRLCGRVGLDAKWLEQQAQSLQPVGLSQLTTSLTLLLGMARDRQRLASTERELNVLSDQLSNAYEELSLIYQLSGGMRVNRHPDEFFRQTCTGVREVIAVQAMGVALFDDRCGQEPVLYGPMTLPQPQLHRLTEQLLMVLRRRRSGLVINNLAADADFKWLAPWAHQIIAVPLQRQDETLGCLFGIDKMAGEFDSVDSKLLNSIANESAIYLENAHLFADANDLLMGLLHSLTSAVDAKDTYTCGHSERVALISQFLAQQVQLSDHEIDRIYMAGLLHDVGKIGVPEIVLQKTGRLTPEEFELMKKHPQVGARILGDVKQLEDVIPGVLCHHERFDGRGYPRGLSGHDIPVMGRIICLADCFDAMTSNRTYRKALPIEVALMEIRRCSGTQFDPALAEAFMDITPAQFRTLLQQHQAHLKNLLDLQESLRVA